MAYSYVGENSTVDIGKLLKIKLKSFVQDDTEPGNFFMKGKKLMFEAPVMEAGDEYETSVSITYTNKKGKAVTQEFDFVIGDSDGTNVRLIGGDDDNSFLLNTATTKKHYLIYGMGGDDKIEPGNGNDKIFGGDGDDEIYGYGGNDILFGEGGNDTINAGLGSNVVSGGDGDDLIYIRGEADVVTGGAGIDSFAVYDSVGQQTITDFVAGVDKLYYEDSRFQESQFAAIATKTATGTLLTFSVDNTVLLEDFFL